jgi:hypothetical protein
MSPADPDRNIIVLPSEKFDDWVKKMDDPTRELPNATARIQRLARQQAVNPASQPDSEPT